MKAGFAEILSAKPADRRQVFESATEVWPTTANLIEKDFVVCATLNVLFSDVPDGAKTLVFKGGTSLSKGHGLIRRFSEDIDLVVMRSALGYSGDQDPLDPNAPFATKKARERAIDDLKGSCAKHLQEVVKPALEECLGPYDIKVDVDPDERQEGQTLLIAYPSAVERPDTYVKPEVKLEGGARSATLPAHPLTIRPYVADVVEVDLDVPDVMTIDAIRTFLDKIVLVHGRHCKFRDKGEIHNKANRESRHYYDLAMMAEKLTEEAAALSELLNDVIEHSRLAFGSAWMKLDEAKGGDLLISPPAEMREAVAKDYQAMRGMIFGDAPSFDWILERINGIDAAFKAAGKR